MLTHIVERCCRLKADVVEQDEREETGLRSILNYGHTFCHAFEAATGYETLLHGEGVAIGMMCAARLAERMGASMRSSSNGNTSFWKRSGCRSMCRTSTATS